jgi:hypothetical protein
MGDRHSYITKIANEMAAADLVSITNRLNTKELSIKNIFIHHVFFWLKEPENAEVRKEFENGLQALTKVPQIRSYHIGMPVESFREVVDDSYTYSYMAFFRSKEDQDIYQTHSIHLKFIDDCQHLWKKVIVYDAMD